MEIIDTDPLYKLFCISMAFLIPLLPSILLYEIAPKDNFKSNGTLGSFKINATGASAIYIVLFAAFYTKVNSVIDNIDAYKQLQYKYDHTPWRIDCKVKLMLDPKHEVDGFQYKNIMDNSSINCIPGSLNCDADNKLISFYVDNKTIEDNKGKLSGMLMINRGFGSASFDSNPTALDANNRVIHVNSTLTKQSNKNYLNQAVHSSAIPVIYKANGLIKAPKI